MENPASISFSPLSPEAALPPLPRVSIAGLSVTAGDYRSVTAQLLAWGRAQEHRYVCVSNVHMVMEGRDNREFQALVNRADVVTSDGMPLVWVLRWRGQKQAQRVYGPTLLLEVCAAAELAGQAVAFYGGAPEVLDRMCAVLAARFPKLKLAERISPPFGAVSTDLDQEHTGRLARCGAGIVFIGLGCPKQERWMAAHTALIPAVLVGVGAAFNFHAGAVRQAPSWLQKIGMEWAFRLAMEPRRLWKRYVWHNPRFIWAVFCEELSRLRRR